ncbi:hypothetical protein IQ62_45675 [Streptomyces scabiei]|nr:hypothetical protein IQ62_45675 [Streptomyces scabiei]
MDGSLAQQGKCVGIVRPYKGQSPHGLTANLCILVLDCTVTEQGKCAGIVRPAPGQSPHGLTANHRGPISDSSLAK